MTCLSEGARAIRRAALLTVCVGGLAATVGCEQSGEAGSATEAPIVAAPAPSSPAPAPAADRIDEPARDPRTSISNRAPAGQAAGATARPAAAGAPPIKIEPAVLDFGFVAPGVDSTGSVAIHNIGKEPVKISLVKPTCRCTTLNDIVGVLIGPGESVALTAQLEGQWITGSRSAAVNVGIDGYEQLLTVDVRAEVSLPVRATPAIFNLATGERNGHVVVESIDRQPFNILAANRQAPRFIEYDPAIDEPRNSYVLEWDLAQYADAELPRWWVIETDHPACPILDTWVRHPATIEIPPREQAWRLADRRVSLGMISPSAPVELNVKVRDMGAARIYAVRSLSAEFDAELVGFNREGSDAVCKVRITPKPGVTGLFVGRVEFIETSYTARLDVIGKIAG